MPALFDRDQIAGGHFLHVMAAHSPLSARLVEEAGFDGIWASGFELSALYGLPDMSLTTMTQHLDTVRAMAARSKLPIIADIDIEDKNFPKVTSLVAGGRQELVRIAEFQGKIEAAITARENSNFLVIARTEALIAGLGQDEALRRAQAYVEAGADMILIHSKQKTPEEIESFVRAWSSTVPLVIVPTAYPQMNEARVRALGKIAMVIYGNHAIRAAVTAMKDVFARILRDGGIEGVDADIVTVEEIFRLQGMDTTQQNEKRFLR